MKIKITFIAISFIIINTQAQTDRINPNHNLYFGANIGLNNINFHYDKTNQGLHGGIFSEYYLAKQWSLTGKVSFFETALDYHHFYHGTTGYFLSSPAKTFNANFSGLVLATSLQIKWEFRLIHNFRGYLKTGYGFYIETYANYSNYINDVNNGNYPSTYSNWLSGLGFTYYINDNYALFFESEYHRGGIKYQSTFGWQVFDDGKRYASNQLFGLGVKYKFKNFKK